MDMDRFIGRLLDNRYEILEVIGTGGMAVVYKARCHRLNRLVAIKILKDEYSQDEEFRRRFHQESQAVAMLSHPNIVSVYDVSTSRDADYIVMELIDGITLKQYMEKKGVLNWKETLHFSTQIAKALEHAHGRGIVHRDIKPHNVMVLKNGSVKVADFGIAQVMSKSNTLTKEALGSVHYISPEQAKGGRVDNRSDLYSLGVVMYEMMTGRPPYDGESPVAVAIKHINGGAPMPSTLNPNIPGGLEQIIMKAMAQDPNRRYASATEMLNDMEEFRKNPSILFDYSGVANQEPQLRVVPPVQPVQNPTPMTTAERMAPSREPARPQPPRRDGQPPRRNPQSGPPRKTREEMDEERSRMTTIAIVACSVVAVIAIGIFLFTLLTGGLFNKQQATILLPDLQGAYYDELLNTDDYQVVLRDRMYHDTFAKGQIISQEPAAGQYSKGIKVYVTVSSGPEPQVKVMEDLVDLEQSAAEEFLNNQDMGLQILVRTENHETIKEGRVTRTDPEENTVLEKGQIICLWISEGPATKKVTMPNVVGQNLSTALGVLSQNGLKKVRYREVEDDAPKDEVVFQSVAKNTEVDVNTEIYLEYSKGPKPTEPPTETTVPPTTQAPTTEPSVPTTTNPDDPSTEPPETSTQPVPDPSEDTTPVPPTDGPEFEIPMDVRIDLPTDRTEPYRIGLRHNGEKVPNYDDQVIDPSTTFITLRLVGSGVQTYEIYIDDVLYKTIEVNFVIDG